MNGSGLNIYKRFINSIAGFNGYKALIREAPGKAILFVILFSFILGIVSIIKPVQEFNASVSDIANGIERQVPDFRLKDGELSVEGKMPVIINNDNITIIIDTSDKADQSLLDNYDNAILLMKNRMVVKNYANKTATSFTSLQDFTMDRNSIKLLLLLLRWIIILFVIFGLVFFIAGKFASAVLISLVGLTANAVMNAGLEYRDIYRISLYSMTLSTILCTILDIIGITPLIPLLLFYIISCIYTWGAVRTISGKTLPQ